MFFQNAYEGKNRWWRWLLTILITLVMFFLGHIPLIVFASREAVRLGTSIEQIGTLALHPDVDRNLFLLLMLIPFAIGFATLQFLISRLHRRSLRSVMTGRPHFDWRRTALGFVVWSLVNGAATFAILPAISYDYQFNASAFWPLLAIGLLLIPIQTTFEEVFFRGYLAQGLSLLLKNKLATFLLVTMMFTLIHVANPEFSTDYATGFGAYLAISTLLGLVAVLDDGLEVPIGIHAANNIFAAVIFSAKDGSFKTDSIFVTTIGEVMKFSPQLDIAICVAAFVILFYVSGWRFSTLLEPTMPVPRSDDGRPMPEVGASHPS